MLRPITGLSAIVALLALPLMSLGAQHQTAAAPAAARAQLVVQCGHPFGGFTAISPDGRFLVNGGAWADGVLLPELNIWSSGGRLLRSIRTAFDESVTGIGFGPSSTQFAVCGKSRRDPSLQMELWSVDGTLVRSIARKAAGGPALGAFSPDGGRFALCSADASSKIIITVYNSRWQVEDSFPLQGAKWLPASLAFSPDGERLICGLRADYGVPGGSLLSLNLRSGETSRLADLSGRSLHFDPYTLAVGPGGELAYWVYTTAERNSPIDGTPQSSYAAVVRVMTAAGAPIGDFPQEVSYTALPDVGLAFLPDGRLVVSTSTAFVERLTNVTYVHMAGRLAAYDLRSGTFTTIDDTRGTDVWLGRPATGRDGTLALLRGSGMRIYRPGGRTPLDAAMPLADLRSLAISPDGKYLLTGPSPFQLWSTEGRLVRRLEPAKNDLILALDFSPNGDIVRVGRNSYDLLGIDGCLKRHVEIQNRPAFDRTFTDGERVVLPLYEESCLVLDAASGKQIGSLSASGRSLAVARGLGYTAQWVARQPTITLLDATGEGVEVSSPDGVASVALASDGTLAWLCSQLDRSASGSGSGARLYLRDPRGGTVREIVVPDSATRVNFSPDGRRLAVSSGEDGRILLLDSSGKRIAELVAARAGVTAICFAPRGDLLAAAYADGDLRLWNTASGRSVGLASDADKWIAFTDDGYFDASLEGACLVGVTRGLESYPIDQAAIPCNRPDLLLGRLGTAGPEEVAYYFRCYLKRLVKAGKVPAAIPAAVFEGRLLAGRDQASASVLTGAYRKDGATYRLVEGVSLATKYRLLGIPAFLRYVEEGFALDVPLPEASIRGSRVDGSRLTLDCRLSDAATGLAYYNVFVNGVPEYGGLGLPLSGTEATVSASVELSAGSNLVELSCTNAALAQSYRASLAVEGPPARRGALYFLGFGESNYADPRLRLGYPKKDAEDLASLFRGLQASYDRVYVRTFTDADCTREAIAGARKLLDGAAVDDTVVLFIAGHGFHDNDAEATYYFLTNESRLENLSGTSAPFDLLEGLLDGIKPRHKLFLMDTCESGDFDAGRLALADAAAGPSGLSSRAIRDASRGLAVQAASARLAAYDRERYINQDLFRRTGAIVFSSSRGGELSFEPAQFSADGNGFFSGAILRGLGGVAADADGDGRVSVDELRSFVAAAVSARTEDRQHPTVDRDNPQGNFSFALAGASLAAGTGEELGAYLVRAARAGRSEEVRALFAAGLKPDADRAGAALTAAAAGGFSDIVGVLLAQGADPRSRDAQNASAARLALDGGHSDVAMAICEAGADIPPALVLDADRRGSIAAIERLLAGGRVIEREGRPDAFLRAIQEGRHGAVRTLFAAGIDTSPDAVYYLDYPRIAHELGRAEIAVYLDGQYDLVARLEKAIDSGDVDEARRLVDAGAPLHSRYFVGQASATGSTAMLRLLLDRGADLYALRGDENPLDYALRVERPLVGQARPQECLTVLGFLLDRGVDVNSLGRSGATALHEALRLDASEGAKYLRSRGAKE